MRRRSRSDDSIARCISRSRSSCAVRTRRASIHAIGTISRASATSVTTSTGTNVDASSRRRSAMLEAVW